MKIIMVLEKDFPPDGRVENEIQQLLSAGHSVDMVCLTKEESYTTDYKTGKLYKFKISKLMYKLSALALGLPFYFNFWQRNIEKVLKSNTYDAIHIHDLPLVEVGLRIKKKYAIKLIADYHENRPEIMKYYPYLKTFPAKYMISLKKWHTYQERVSPLVDKLILVTQEAKEYYIQKFGLNPEDIHVVANYANIEEFDSIPIDKKITEEVSKKFCITYFGDTGERRGVIELIKVASELNAYTDILFYIIGDSSEQHLLEREVERQKAENVVLTGYIPFNKAASYMISSKIGVCPFHRNVHHDTTYANKMFQYMHYGLPIIVSDCPSQKIIVEQDNCGLVFEAGNVGDLKKCILQLYNDQNFRNELGLKGKQKVVEKYNWETAGKAINALYEGIQ